jgi:hypothetical protein
VPSTKRLIRSPRKPRENHIPRIKSGDAFLHNLGQNRRCSPDRPRRRPVRERFRAPARLRPLVGAQARRADPPCLAARRGGGDRDRARCSLLGSGGTSPRRRGHSRRETACAPGIHALGRCAGFEGQQEQSSDHQRTSRLPGTSGRRADHHAARSDRARRRDPCNGSRPDRAIDPLAQDTGETAGGRRSFGSIIFAMRSIIFCTVGVSRRGRAHLMAPRMKTAPHLFSECGAQVEPLEMIRP